MALTDRVRRVHRTLPTGADMSDTVWMHRHLTMVKVLLAHSAGLVVFGVVQGEALAHVGVDALAPVALAAVAMHNRLGRTVRACATALGLMVCAAELVHLAGGSIEAHFDYFVLLGLLALYESWTPFLVSLGFVVLQHGVMAATVADGEPGSANPLAFAAVHGVFVLAAACVITYTWQQHERDNTAARELLEASAARYRELIDVEFAQRAAREEAERQLQRSEALFRSLASEAPIGIFMADDHGDLVFVNAAYEAILQLSAEEALSGDWISRVHPDDIGHVDAWRAAIAQGREYSCRARVRRGDGQLRTVEVVGTTTLSRDGGSAFVGTVQDVTTATEAAAALADARDRALAASELKSRFLANMSHEIRTPIGGIIGLADVLLDEIGDGPGRGHLVTLQSAGQHLLAIINDILDLSKIEAGKFELARVPFSPAEAVRQAVALFAGAAADKDVALRVEIADDLEDPVVGDPTRVRQVVNNLVSNAVKFTAAGEVRVTVTTSGRDLERSMMTVVVCDTGIGIDLSNGIDILEPFEQGDTSTTRQFGGTGLGLAICRELTSRMGGALAIDSSPGVGTRVTATMAVEHVPPDMAGDAATVPREPARVGRVLIVEDNAINQVVCAALIRKLGFECDIAGNGEEGVAAAAANAYDFILMDCQMPVLDGYGATKAIRALPGSAATVPIVTVTASALPEDRDRCLDAGMDDYIAKPLSLPRMETLVASVLRARRPAPVMTA